MGNAHGLRGRLRAPQADLPAGQPFGQRIRLWQNLYPGNGMSPAFYGDLGATGRAASAFPSTRKVSVVQGIWRISERRFRNEVENGDGEYYLKGDKSKAKGYGMSNEIPEQEKERRGSQVL